MGPVVDSMVQVHFNNLTYDCPSRRFGNHTSGEYNWRRKHLSCRLCNQKNYKRNIGENNLLNRGKQNQATVGICQNLLQCRSACDMNINMSKKKRNVDEAFDPDYDYVYGMTEYRISLTEDVLKDDTELRKSVTRILEVIVGLLKDRAVGSDSRGKACHKI